MAVVVLLVLVVNNNQKQNENQNKNEETVEASADITENDTITVAIEQPETNQKTTDWNLILVNKDNPIPENYQYELATVESNHKVDAKIVEPLNQMLADARREGLKPLICSSYRTLETQTTLFNQKVSQHIRLGYEQRRSRRNSILLGNQSTNK